MQGLSEKQRKLLEFIEEHIAEERLCPSYRDMQKHLKLKSISTIHKHIQTLIRKGYLENDRGRARSLALASKKKESHSIPIVGTFSLEKGIVMEKALNRSLELPSLFVPRPTETYFLIAQGEKLLEHGLCDGDLLLVEARQDIIAGELAICEGPLLTNNPPEGARILAVLVTSIRSHREKNLSPNFFRKNPSPKN